MADCNYFAHSTQNPDKSDWQCLRDHLLNVARISADFAGDFNVAEVASAAGLLHDLGKYSREFQSRLTGDRIRVDHATAGAQEAVNRFHPSIGRMLSYVVTGHHGGLLNFGSAESGLAERMIRTGIPDYSGFRDEIVLPDSKSFRLALKPFTKRIGFCTSFFTRIMYSCLVDADSLDTENFLAPEKFSIRGQYDSFDTLREIFFTHMQEINSGAENSSINRERKNIFDQCIAVGLRPPGIFSLTVPTGGGKTLSSMAFALEHLKKNDLKRIFYVIPYTSIIEQNAKVFRDIFGNRNVLEHHSNFDPTSLKNENEDPVVEPLRLAAENWDMPVVVTTNVQFFESLFSNKRSRCRKLHNLAKSIIILDEAQMLPTGFLQPCLAALSELVRNYGSTVVICTATQPKLGDLLDESLKPWEIIESPGTLFDIFRRVRVTNLGVLNDGDLSTRLKEHQQVLCIVNTRTHAKKLYDELEKSGNCYHLSARMCPAHRRAKIEEIKRLLKEGKDCRVVSTQLIEAGVDIDFPAVYRSMSGIDSIAQAAGRCNREGRMTQGDVFVFRSLETYAKGAPWQNRVAEIGEMTVHALPELDPLSPGVVEEYFRTLYRYEDLDLKKILSRFEERSKELAFPFEDVASDFQLIEGGTNDLIVPFDKNADQKIKELRRSDSPWRLARDLQGYTVSIYPNEFRELMKMNAVEMISDRFWILRSREDYSNETGLANRTSVGYDGSLLLH